jgi:hypothetical protein
VARGMHFVRQAATTILSNLRLKSEELTHGCFSPVITISAIFLAYSDSSAISF